MNQAHQAAKADGKDLMIRSGTALPAVCVKSNKAVDVSCVRKERLCWTPSAHGKTVLLILRFVANRQHCDLAYGLSPGTMLWYHFGFAAKIFGAMLGPIGMFATVIFITSKSAQNPYLFGCLLMTIIFMAFLPFGNRPLRIVRQQRDVFWIRGFSKEYLNRFR